MSAEYTPTTEVVKDACTFPRQRLGEPRDMTPEAFDRWHAAEIAAAEKRGAVKFLSKQWSCGVVHSGYHNGAGCSPKDPHGGWGCGWYYMARVPANQLEGDHHAEG